MAACGNTGERGGGIPGVAEGTEADIVEGWQHCSGTGNFMMFAASRHMFHTIAVQLFVQAEMDW